MRAEVQRCGLYRRRAARRAQGADTGGGPLRRGRLRAWEARPWSRPGGRARRAPRGARGDRERAHAGPGRRGRRGARGAAAPAVHVRPRAGGGVRAAVRHDGPALGAVCAAAAALAAGCGGARVRARARRRGALRDCRGGRPGVRGCRSACLAVSGCVPARMPCGIRERPAVLLAPGAAAVAAVAGAQGILLAATEVVPCT
jgi:hypothetical protein